jgi:hypothetical protein
MQPTFADLISDILDGGGSKARYAQIRDLKEAANGLFMGCLIYYKCINLFGYAGVFTSNIHRILAVCRCRDPAAEHLTKRQCYANVKSHLKY